MIAITWQEVYQLPLRYDEYSLYAWSANGTMALTFLLGIKGEDIKKIVETINGNANCKIEGLTHEDADFKANGKTIFMVRGWGHLTGTGGLNLPEDEAVKIQDGFINHVYQSLTGNTK